RHEAGMIAPLPPGDLVLETERLILTPFGLEDTELAIALWCDPEVMRYVGDPDDPQEVRDIMPTIIRRGAGGRIGSWVIHRKDRNEKVGEVFLWPTPIDDDDIDFSQVVPDAYPRDVIEVGYVLLKMAWGQGIATEACARLLRFAFEKTTIATIYATIEPENAASQSVLTKCGLYFIGEHRAWGEDAPWYQITRQDWQERLTT
ncbi:MAG: GNAT family N-acetyltransferase, partial [Pseudomonadota bacterium]